MLEARRCPDCGETYYPPARTCQKDGARLQVSQTLIGTTLDDRYRIDDILGMGGMGTVYRATHIHLDSAFAVKVLHPEMISFDGAIERFRREAKAARRIHHPNAIEVTDFGVTPENLVYLVMEIVEGRLLREMINVETFDYRRAVEILCQVCAAIQVAHDNNVIHRDLKPDNIIVRKIGDKEAVKVLDFGIAKLLEANQPTDELQVLTKQGMLIGTPQYMSPEQCQGRDLEPSSDLYSLGLIGYEMLCGRMPFLSEKPMGYISKHLRDTPTPLREIAPQVPTSVERVIMQTLEKEPEARPSSATELAHQLRLAAQEAGEKSKRVTLIEAQPLDKATQEFSSPVSTPNKSSKAAESEPLLSRDTRVLQSVRKTASGKDTQLMEEEPFVKSKSRSPLIALVAGLVLVLGAVAYFGFIRPSKTTQSQDPQTSNQQGPVSSDQFGEMVLIRGGNFMMGAEDGDIEERPVHEVSIKNFYLDKTEVTNEQYKKCVDAGRCPAPLNWKNGSHAPKEELLPVTHVTWSSAVAFARFAGKRLPTESEWEYAARGGNQNNLYPWGAKWIDSAANVGRIATNKPAPVKSFQRDQVFGVFDLAGNVSEWVEDDYTTYEKREPIKGCPGCKVYRGGNFVDEIQDSRASRRWSVFPDVPRPFDEDVLPKLGFRCAKDAK